MSGGREPGFNGGQLLVLAIGGCLCNDLHDAAHRHGIRLRSFESDALLAIAASVQVAVEAADVGAVIGEVVATSAVSNSIARGLPARVTAAGT